MGINRTGFQCNFTYPEPHVSFGPHIWWVELVHMPISGACPLDGPVPRSRPLPHPLAARPLPHLPCGTMADPCGAMAAPCGTMAAPCGTIPFSIPMPMQPGQAPFSIPLQPGQAPFSIPHAARPGPFSTPLPLQQGQAPSPSPCSQSRPNQARPGGSQVSCGMAARQRGKSNSLH